MLFRSCPMNCEKRLIPLTHVSSPISETIHISPLITTIKKNKIVSLLFSVGLTFSLIPHLPYSLPYLYIYVISFIHFLINIKMVQQLHCQMLKFLKSNKQNMEIAYSFYHASSSIYD